MIVQYLEEKVHDMEAVQKTILLRLENIEKLIQSQVVEKRTGHAHPDESSWKHNSFNNLDNWQSCYSSTYCQASLNSPPRLQAPTNLLLQNLMCNVSIPSHRIPTQILSHSLPPLLLALNHTLPPPLLALRSLPNFQAVLSMDQTYTMVSQVACQKHYLFAQNPMQLLSPLTRSGK